MARAIRLKRGVLLPSEKQSATLLPLASATVPPQLRLTLGQYGGDTLFPVVAAGDAVRMGQVLAQPRTDEGVPLHAPVSGHVLGLAMQPAMAGGDVPTLVIANDGRDERDPSLTGVGDFTRIAPETLRWRIAAGGIVGLGGAAFPAHRKLQAADNPVEDLLLNGVECEPFVSCDDALMRHRAADVVHGAQALLHVLGASRCTIAVEADKPEAMQAMQAALGAAADARLKIVSVPVNYPAGGERQLIAHLYGREVPANGLPRDLGIVCHNVGTAAAIATLLQTGEPLMSRVVTITGHGVRQARNLEVRFGTSINQLLADCGGCGADVIRLIAGGSMLGIALPHDDFPVMQTTHCIIAATTRDVGLRGEEMPCIRCGDCATVCPAGLLPQELHRHARFNDDEALARYGLADCIECGCCDHVCPSQIPLTATFATARQQLRFKVLQGERSALARERFEAHTHRLAAEEAEKQRKLKDKRTSARQEVP